MCEYTKNDIMTITSNISAVNVISSPSDDYHPPGYILKFEDHFDGTSIDTNKWTVKYGGVSLANSIITIGTENVGGSIVTGSHSGPGLTKYSFKYGYMAVIAKFTDSSKVNAGWCNQLWTWYDYGAHGEIDLTETGSVDIQRFRPNVHCTGCGGKEDTINFNREINVGVDLSKAFHVYSFLWSSDYIKFYFDGVLKATITPSNITIPSTNQFIYLSLCKKNDIAQKYQCDPARVLGEGTGRMYIDYVRVYQKA